MLTACQPQIASLGPVIEHIRPSVVDIRQSGLTFLEPNRNDISRHCEKAAIHSPAELAPSLVFFADAV